MSNEQTEDPQPILTLDFEDGGGTHLLSSIDDAIAWIDRERSEWAWLEGNPPGFQAEGRRMPKDVIDELLNNLKESLIRYKKNNVAEWPSLFAKNCDERFRWGGNLIHSKSRLGVFLASMGKESPASAAWVATLLTQKYITITVNSHGGGTAVSWDLLHGAFRTVAMLEGIPSHKDEANAIKQLHATAQSEIDRQITKFTTHENTWNSHNQHIANIFDEWSRTENALKASYEAAISEHKAKLSQIQQDYTNRMPLRAPAKYWQDRALRFHVLEVLWGVVSLAACVMGVWKLPELARWINEQTPRASQISESSETVGVPVLLSLTQELPGIIRFGIASAIMLWVIRICVRNYLSASHLAADASERRMMIQTYLALISDPDVQKSEKLKEQVLPKALESIFRHAADGLVKDDGMPTISAIPVDLTKLK